MLSKIRKQKLEKNIWKFYLYRVFASIMFITPIFVLFYQENGLNMTQVMILQSVYTAGVMLAVIPAGIIADYIGRKKVLIANAVFFVLAWALFARSYGFVGFLIAEIVISLSSAMWMASGNAFFYDNLRELKQEGSFKKLYGNVIGINYLTWGVSALIGGYIAAGYSFRITYWWTALIAVFALLITFSFTDTEKYKHGDKHYFSHLKDAAKFAENHPRVRLFMVYTAIIFTIVFVGYIFYQPYFESIKIPLVYFGWIYFGMNLLAAAGSKISHRIENFLGERKILILVLITLIISFLGMAKGLIVLGAVFPILISFSVGVFDPVITDYMNKHIESYHRATVLSLHTLLTNVFATVAAPFFGWIVDFWSLKQAYVMACFILIIDLVILIVAFTFIKRMEK